MGDRKKVCIIGAGLAGLVSLKSCLAENFDVTCFESRSELGGQWAAQPDADPLSSSPEKAQSSMYDGVVLNSCRDTSALPDFPADPARYGDYFSHRQQLRYLSEYAVHFGLLAHIRFGRKVVRCVPDGEHGEGMKWRVTSRKVDEEEGDEAEDQFDAVFVGTGHLSTPSVPKFEGKSTFKGEFLHSHYYKRPGPFDRKKVALIGMGSSAVDIACELAPGAEEVHLITRRGGWVLPRYVLGKPTEAWDNRATQVWIPLKVGQWTQTKLLELVEGKAPEVMRPKHRLLEQSPTVRGDFIEKVRTGVIIVHRGNVDRLTEDGLMISSHEKGLEEVEELEVDVIIACTGYNQFDQPFLPSDALRHPESKGVDLYKLIVPPKYPNLFMIGHAELVGPAAPVFDAQARWVCSVVAGRVQLPSQEAMRDEIAKLQAFQAKHFLGSERHALALYMIPYTDDLLEPLGAAPSFRRCLSKVFTSGHPWRALKVLNAVWFGIPSAAQWRLFGHGAMAELATETVLRIADGGKTLSKKEVRLLNLGEGKAYV